MLPAQEKRLHEEMAATSVKCEPIPVLRSDAKRLRLEIDASAAITPARHASTDHQHEYHNQQQPSVNGVSPDSCDDDDDDVEEPALFSSPRRLCEDVRVCGSSGPAQPQQSQPQMRRIARAPEVHGAVTKLHSLQQLEAVFGTAPLPCDGPVELSAPSLPRLRAGETAIVVLHNGSAEARELLRPHTGELSKCRIFRLDLNTLPPCEYERIGDGGHRISGVPQDAACQEQYPVSLSPPSLSSHILRGTERLLQRLTTLLRTDEVLNPCDPEAPSPTPLNNGDAQSSQHATTAQMDPPAQEFRGKREELTLPAMIVWRAEGAPEDEYVNNGKNSRSDVGNEDGLVAAESYGRPLVVKQLTVVDQLHSLSLFAPVYTIEHFLRTVATTALFPKEASSASSAPADNATNGTTACASGTRSFIYFGASWCPPCMRIVGVLPAMLKEDFPSNVTCCVKADMDLAMPLYDFFDVKIIPTFIMFDNDVLRQAGNWDALRSGKPLAEATLQQLKEGLRRSELGRIQNSQRLIVRSFIEKHSAGLKFDDDF
ncbi:hypothetical protein DQ04_17611000 [Trypanosoma grayi]|uniref:hypothetical protein n=1 Tax=Trypanosoma grayi TaxID=71804 RepID=UPI0004F428C9|nr:hypothetical protein DQ04_17611000 [Trypanosoma grayi]KEG05882.1 hypothetical protein DQ04_17611000 [Trypanosoma grayi]